MVARGRGVSTGRAPPRPAGAESAAGARHDDDGDLGVGFPSREGLDGLTEQVRTEGVQTVRPVKGKGRDAALDGGKDHVFRHGYLAYRDYPMWRTHYRETNMQDSILTAT